MPYARRMPAGDICKEALALQGLPVPNSIATNTTNVTARQVWVQLRTQGRRLAKPMHTHRWQVLSRTWEFDTVPGQTLYNLPGDFLGFEDMTAWNTTSRLPLIGPANGPQWQTMNARGLGSTTISITYRTVQDKLELYGAPSSAQHLSIMYTSRGWVDLIGTPGVFADAPTEDGDIVMLDPEMMVAAVQYGFMVAKGFDTSEIAAQLAKLIEVAIDIDVDAPILSAAASSTYPLLTTQFNVPDTGLGS